MIAFIDVPGIYCVRFATDGGLVRELVASAAADRRVKVSVSEGVLVIDVSEADVKGGA